MYAFPSPEQPGRLVLVLDVHPLAALTAAFSDAIVYRFRLRPLTIAPDRPAFPFGPEESELTFACSFEAPQHGLNGARPVQYGSFVAPSGDTTRFRVDDDFMDTLYNWLINADHGPRISDGVDQATQPASDVFPYLMPPNPVPVTELHIETVTRA